MKTHSLEIWWLRLVTFSLAALAASSAVYWALKWGQPPTTGAAPAISRSIGSDPKAVARLLGGGATNPAALADSAANRVKLLGVVTTGVDTGYALLSVDGKPARSYRVGAPVSDSLVLHSLTPRSAALAPKSDASASFTLELPALAVAVGKDTAAAGSAKRSRASRSADSAE